MEHSEEVKRICAEAYLSHVRSLAVRVKSLQAEIEVKKNDLLPGALSYREHVSASVEVDALESAICELQELIGEYATELRGYIDEQRIAHAVLQRLDDPKCAAAFTSYYIDAMPWERVCVDLGYSWPGIMKMRKRALCAVYDLMPENWRREPIPNAMT